MGNPEMCKEDGLVLPEAGPWAKTKHIKIQYYFQLFSTSMKKKWKTRVYIDLFASAGKARIKSTNEIIPGSPLLALEIKDQFDNYIFVEKDQEYIGALKKRIDSLFPNQNCSYINGDCNLQVKSIISAIPSFDRINNGLSLCFIDPYNSNQLNFNTIREISKIYVDFLILIPSYMDINRNEHAYIKEDNPTLDLFLGTDKWREDWRKNRTNYNKFGLFIADYFCIQMKNLGYIYNNLSDMELIKMEVDQNLPLYHIAFFSRNKLGYKFWMETKKNTTKQFDLCFDEE
ncbi:MAG: hypothetical protein AMQ22_02212 [Candidatus Methanofastidiosum methylothiophilum]|uniref:Three-Cys-motif partner protein TcmP n=1 Tax=Candidatus Methanofastidiosum methylothiophilum TaxID=1705564 RepID=A0A150IKA6_9EURY|nr:MAG: hypothetical protein AMQ22_02212 [Candidatus Methanofastidiosum methylthiophilus]